MLKPMMMMVIMLIMMVMMAYIQNTLLLNAKTNDDDDGDHVDQDGHDGIHPEYKKRYKQGFQSKSIPIVYSIPSEDG